MIYRYDPDAVTEVTEELTLYTVEESSFYSRLRCSIISSIRRY